jgi:hypothetical protein
MKKIQELRNKYAKYTVCCVFVIGMQWFAREFDSQKFLQILIIFFFFWLDFLWMNYFMLNIISSYGMSSFGSPPTLTTQYMAQIQFSQLKIIPVYVCACGDWRRMCSLDHSLLASSTVLSGFQLTIGFRVCSLFASCTVMSGFQLTIGFGVPSNCRQKQKQQLL